MGSASVELGIKVVSKLKRVLHKNVGFDTYTELQSPTPGDVFDTWDTKQEFTPHDLVYFKYAPIVSADVERSYSMYKNILTDNLPQFTFSDLVQWRIKYGPYAYFFK